MTPRPRLRYGPPIFVVVVCVVAWFAGGVDVGVLSTASGRADAWQRGLQFLGGFVSPDLSAEAIWQGVRLSAETIAVALWGTVLGSLGALVLGVLASRSVANADGPGRPRTRWIRVGAVRVVLDVMRGIPDFAWALGLLAFVGPGPVTGTLAIAISVAGLLGKTFSQLIDNLPPAPVRSVAATGGRPAVIAAYGHIPAAGPALLSHALLRFECSLRNASVIGIVGGGGLGAQFFEELGFGRFDRVATLLLFLLALTAAADFASDAVRQRLRIRAPTSLARRSVVVGVGIALLATFPLLAGSVVTAVEELSRIDLAFVGRSLAALATPTLIVDAIRDTAAQSLVPLSMAWLGTLFAFIAAVGVIGVASRQLLHAQSLATAAKVPMVIRLGRAAAWRGARGLALVCRAVPDVVWLLIFAVMLRYGTLAAILAVAVHSFGVLTRLFSEAVDDVPHRLIERRNYGRIGARFGYGVWPEVAPTIWTHTSVQAESNVRTGLVLGIVGAGGLGDAFHSSLSYWHLSDASLQALAMIGLTVAVDRLTRRWLHTAAQRRHARLRAG